MLLVWGSILVLSFLARGSYFLVEGRNDTAWIQKWVKHVYRAVHASRKWRPLRDALASMGPATQESFQFESACSLRVSSWRHFCNVGMPCNAICPRCGLCAPKAARYKSTAVSPSAQSVGKARLGMPWVRNSITLYIFYHMPFKISVGAQSGLRFAWLWLGSTRRFPMARCGDRNAKHRILLTQHEASRSRSIPNHHLNHIIYFCQSSWIIINPQHQTYQTN